MVNVTLLLLVFEFDAGFGQPANRPKEKSTTVRKSFCNMGDIISEHILSKEAFHHRFRETAIISTAMSLVRTPLIRPA